MEVNRKQLGISLILVGVFFLFAHLHSRHLEGKAIEKFLVKEYHGIINEIIYPKRGAFPYVKVDSALLHFGMSEVKVRSYIQIKDSIVKKSGTTEIIVYRKNLKGEWHEKVFK
jgi:hypothetical protein